VNSSSRASEENHPGASGFVSHVRIRERRSKVDPFPYWLSGGTEWCFVCGAAYVLELERRCVACDRGSCPHCVFLVRTTREVYCLPCQVEIP